MENLSPLGLAYARCPEGWICGCGTFVMFTNNNRQTYKGLQEHAVVGEIQLKLSLRNVAVICTAKWPNPLAYADLQIKAVQA
jgi:hypothetical protein